MRNITAGFLRKIFNGKKKYFTQNEIQKVKTVFYFKELRMDNVLKEYPKRNELLEYLPDHKQLYRIDKIFFLNISNTVIRGYIDQKTTEEIQKR